MTSQRGGFAIGLIIGLLLGLALALGVALYVTKVPVPFIDKVPQRTAEQDAAEAARNKNWEPNAPLAGKPAVKAAASAAASPAPAAQGVARAPAAVPPQPPATTGKPAPAASGSAGKSTKAGADAFTYFVQVGAYTKPEDAEQQRARVGLLGVTAKVTEREQSGRTVYRVRLGPFDRKEDADAAQERLASNGVEAALVRVER